MPKKTAIILFNLGGPDSPKAIRPFLYNLFADKHIIDLPTPFRHLLAWIISTSRYKKVTPLYEIMGGKSPIVPNTLAQMAALEATLNDDAYQCFACMRYWHPMTKETVAKVKQYAPDQIILLPMYPHYSTTTTESSIEAWHQEAKRQKLDVPTQAICCYPTETGFISSVADLLNQSLQQVKQEHPTATPRLLFSAHGLPKKTVESKSDPYPTQIEMTAQAVIKHMGKAAPKDWMVSYQSRVGPMEWIQPYTEAEIHRAGADKVPLVIVPIAFTCEHLETLVELDYEYHEVATKAGVPGYYRVPAVGTHPDYIKGLAGLIGRVTANKKPMQCHQDEPVCPRDGKCDACPCLM